MSQSRHATINYHKGWFAIDNGEGFSLHNLKVRSFLRNFPTGNPIMHYPKQVSFGEDGTVLVGGSDHGAVYVFDTEMGCPLDLLHHSDHGLVQTLTVSRQTIQRVGNLDQCRHTLKTGTT